MFGGAVVRRVVALIAAALLLVVLARAQDSAHSIAEKFASEADRAQAAKKEAARKADEAKKSKEAERKAGQARRSVEARQRSEAARAEAEAQRRAEETRGAEEQEMLARARQEAGEKRATEEIRRLIEQAEAESAKAEELLAREAEQARVKAAQPGPAQPSRAEAEDDARRVAQQVEAERTKVAEQERLALLRAAENRRLAQQLTRVRHVRAARLAAQARRLAQEAEAEQARVAEQQERLALLRVQENRRSVEKLTQVRRLRDARLAAQARRVEADLQVAAAKSPDRNVAQAPAPAAAAPVVTPGPSDERSITDRATAKDERPPAEWDGRRALGGERDQRVTVLLVMAPGTYGIRRGANIADPVLCGLDGCYVSIGADTAAVFLPRRKALGFGNTFGARAGACRQKLGCVFRDVELEFPGVLRPVDLHILKHDRRRPQIVTADSDCRLASGYLTCNRGIYAEDYAMWIVPERLAAAAGPDALERAVREGLKDSRAAEFAPRPAR